MEKLRLIQCLSLCMVVFFTITTPVSAQESFITFKKVGSPVLKANDSLKSFSKGARIYDGCTLSLKEADSVVVINQKGDCYALAGPKTYTYDAITKVPPVRDQESFTKKYLTYVWNQFTNNQKSKSKTGVVFRQDNINLLFPPDSAMVAKPEINFNWETQLDNKLYFHLQDVESGHMMKFGLTGKEFSLVVDDKFIKRGRNYRWAVSKSLFPDTETTKFRSIRVMDDSELEARKDMLKAIEKDLKQLGYTTEEIDEMLCSDYKLCY